MMWRWQPGRQPGVAYRKLLLARVAPWFDAWLIDYPANVDLPWHRDRVPGRRHWRLNIAIRRGGAHLIHFDAHGNPRAIRSRVALFRSDELHCVTNTKSRRLVLSFGFTRVIRSPACGGPSC